jgi:hypothetical protein
MTPAARDRALFRALIEYARSERTDPAPALDPALTASLVDRALQRVRPPSAAQAHRPARALGRSGRRPALACALLLTALVFRPTETASLPSYTLTLRSGDRTERGPLANEPGSSAVETPHAILSPGSELRVALLPAEPHHGPIEVVIEAREGRGRVLRLRPAAVRGEDGALLIRAIVGRELDLPPGRWSTIWRVRARDGSTTTPGLPLRLTVTER